MPFPIAYLYLNFINRYLKSDVNWTLGKELLNLSILLLLIGIAGFLIRDLIYTNSDNWSLRYFLEEIRNTFLIGFLLLIIVLPINFLWFASCGSIAFNLYQIHSNVYGNNELRT